MANTGRTTSQWTAFFVDDSGGTLREIAVNTINGVSLTYPQLDLTAWMDAVHGALPETPDCVISIGGPLDSLVTTGTLTVLKGIAGVPKALALDVQVGIRHDWVSGEPQFGISWLATRGFVCSAFDPNLDDMTYTAEFKMYPGSAAPAWGTTAET